VQRDIVPGDQVVIASSDEDVELSLKIRSLGSDTKLGCTNGSNRHELLTTASVGDS